MKQDVINTRRAGEFAKPQAEDRVPLATLTFTVVMST
jgi:hypothetical protein